MTDWHTRAIIYQIDTALFYDLNGDGCGDIAGIAAKAALRENVARRSARARWASAGKPLRARARSYAAIRGRLLTALAYPSSTGPARSQGETGWCAC